MDETYGKLLEKVKNLLGSGRETEEKFQRLCILLRSSVPQYDWVGFYMVEGDELVLGPYSGAPTEHTRIPIGKGICGQAAQSEDTFIVPDVSGQDNYLACSIDVKSEVVVPLFKNGAVVGELDIDSHSLDAFGDEDREFLERVCGYVAELL